MASSKCRPAVGAATAPGRHFMEGHDAAVRVLTQGLIDLKLLTGDLDNLIDALIMADQADRLGELGTDDAA